MGKSSMLLLLLALALAADSLTAKAQQAPSAESVLAPVLKELRQKTRVPLRLPTDLAFIKNDPTPFYASIYRATTSGYEINVDFSPDCHGMPPCRYGTVAGQAIKAGARRPSGRRVRLAGGITGYFVDSKCGASCSDSEMRWDQNGYRYMVSLKAGALKDVVKIADSAIRNRIAR